MPFGLENNLADSARGGPDVLRLMTTMRSNCSDTALEILVSIDRRHRAWMTHRIEAIMRYAILLGILLAPLAWAQTGRHPKPASPKDFAVMAWGNSPSDPDQLR